MRLAFRILAFLSLLSVLAALGQGPEKDEQPKSKPPEFQEFCDSALAAPPELAADLLLKLLERGAIKASERKAELIEQAFQLALAAKYALKIVGGAGLGYSTDSDMGALTRSLEVGLDTLSLRCRAVRQMLLLDETRALELFRQIPRPDPPRLSCKDAFGYSLASYYALVAELANTAFTPAERKDGVHIQFLESHLLAMSSPFQLEGTADAIAAAKLAPTDLERMVAAYAGTLKEVDADPRSFASARYSVTQALGRLGVASQRSGVPPYLLVDAARAFLVKHMAGARCAELADEQKASAPIIAFFNASLLPMLGTAGAAIEPLRQEELKAKRIDDGAVYSEFWARRADVLPDGVKRLRFGITEEQRRAVGARGLRSDGRADFLTLEERKDPQWEVALRDFLSVVETKTRDWDESEAVHFHKISFTYIPLIDLTPPGELQDMIVKSFVGFLKRSQVERNSPPEWLMEFTRLVLHGDGTPQGRNRILEEIRRTGDSVMNLYLELELLAPKPQQQPVPPAISR